MAVHQVVLQRNHVMPTREQILTNHIPHRLCGLDGLATMLLLRTPFSVSDVYQVEDEVEHSKSFQVVIESRGRDVPYDVVYNAVVEAGFAHARSLLNFLGVAIDHGTTPLSLRPYKSRDTDLLFNQVSGARPLKVEDVRLLNELDLTEIDGVYSLEHNLAHLIHVADKGVAHMTTGYVGGWAGHVIRSCAFIEVAYELLVYKATGTRIPDFHWWSQSLLPDQIRTAHQKALEQIRTQVLKTIPSWS